MRGVVDRAITSVSGSATVSIEASADGINAVPAAILVTANANTAPEINNTWDANDVSLSQLLLTTPAAIDPNHPGTDSHLIYSWTLTPTSGNTIYEDSPPPPPVTFTVNNSNSAKIS